MWTIDTNFVRGAFRVRGDGVEVQERTLRFQDVLDADEIFLTGNFSKVLPVVKVEDHEYQQGQFANLANKLYFEFAAREGQKGFDRGG